MDSNNNNSQVDNVEKLKEIPKWTRRYAENRILTIIVLMAMICLVGGVFAFSLSFGLAAFKGGNVFVAGICAAFVAVILILLTVFITKFCGKNKGLIDQIIDQRIYGKEGITSMPKPKSSKKKTCLEIVIAVVFFIWFFGSWHLALKGIISYKYLQPVSALYYVPYMVCGWYFFQSPRMGPVYLLQPTLYAIHAILILAGVPIYFTTENFFIFSVCIPMIGYGFLTFIISYIYGRYALKKLKGIAHLEGDVANGV